MIMICYVLIKRWIVDFFSQLEKRNASQNCKVLLFIAIVESSIFILR